MEIFLTSQASNVLDDICHHLRKHPGAYHLAFIPTASNLYEKPWWIEEDKSKLIELGFEITDVDIEHKNQTQLRNDFSDIDIVFVAGGNTQYLLEKIRESGFDKIISELNGHEKIYIGSSAGSVILAPDIEPSKYFDDRKDISNRDTKGLGLINFVPLPHFGKEKYRELNEKILSEYNGWEHEIIPMSDTQYLHIQDSDKKMYDIAKSV